MTRSEWASRGQRGLQGALAAAGLAATLLTAMPVASASAAPQTPPGSVMIESVFHGYVLCAGKDDESVYLKPIDTTNKYCKWQQIMSPSGAFSLYNAAKDQVMAYPNGGDGGAVVMEDAQTTDDGNIPNTELWSWGGQEDWGASALQSFADSGQNVDAKNPTGDGPRKDAVHTRGWRHGNQRELTWNAIPAR